MAVDNLQSKSPTPIPFLPSVALNISAIRVDDQKDDLQLNISWNPGLGGNDDDGGGGGGDGGYNLYDVKVWHIATERCMIQPTLFVNQQNLTCAPIHIETVSAGREFILIYY